LEFILIAMGNESINVIRFRHRKHILSAVWKMD